MIKCPQCECIQESDGSSTSTCWNCDHVQVHAKTYLSAIGRKANALTLAELFHLCDVPGYEDVRDPLKPGR